MSDKKCDFYSGHYCVNQQNQNKNCKKDKSKKCEIWNNKNKSKEKPQPAIRNGWFWWCPIIYYKEKNDKVPFLCAKYWCLGWLFELTLFIHNSMLVISDYLGIDIDKSYPIRLEK